MPIRISPRRRWCARRYITPPTVWLEAICSPPSLPSEDPATAQPRLEEFDALVKELLPSVRELLPHLSDIEALRTTARMAEYRLNAEETLVWASRRFPSR
ncbi:MAG: hypothetical protein JWL60_1447 [Gemmatimonadetes bacterium]|jgi:hypothetical protein|nr:hypothetical protein [Gemmatimonadota bacterium]